MNLLDMHTREKLYRIHLDELQQDVQNARGPRELGGDEPEIITAHRRHYLAMALRSLVALLAVFTSHRAN
jgi:hypothetical protein